MVAVVTGKVGVVYVVVGAVAVTDPYDTTPVEETCKLLTAVGRALGSVKV